MYAKMTYGPDSGAEVRFGPFVLDVRLGQGGMGEVWKARVADDEASGSVVVKRLLPHLVSDDELEHSFLREARIAQRLDHPNIVRSLRSGRVGNMPYLSMEWLRGIDVHRLVRDLRARKDRVPPGFAAHIAERVCEALAYAHETPGESGTPMHLVHRDVSPSNVMITYDGQVKLLDFGIAKAMSEATAIRTSTGTLKGKLGYMAPELLDGVAASHASDQFSVGVMLHEMLTGTRLFRGESDVQTMAKVRELAIVPPDLIEPLVSPQLSAICMRALARSPEHRFASCAEMADALRELAVTEPWDEDASASFLRDLPPSKPELALRIPLPLPFNDGATDVQVAPVPAAPSIHRVAIASLVIVLATAFATGAYLRISRHAKAKAPLVTTRTQAEPPVKGPEPVELAPTKPTPPPTPIAVAEPDPIPERSLEPKRKAPLRVRKTPSKNGRAPGKGTDNALIKDGKVVDPFSN